MVRHLEEAAAQEQAAPALITFEPHPRCVLDPANCPRSITTLREKLGLIDAAGVEHAIVLRFDRELASLSPQEFIDRLSAVMDIKRWVIGYDFAFGRGRTGSADWLRTNGHPVEVVPPFNVNRHELHSSEVRRLITEGDVDVANRLLGREYSMSGPVEAGAQVGRTLGFPTANISPEPNKLVPALGAYAGRVHLFGGTHEHPAQPASSFGSSAEGDFVAALSVGYRPTFGGTELKVEAFLLDFEGDLYQRRLELRFVRWLHPDIRFATPADLVQQLKKDAADTRRIVGG